MKTLLVILYGSSLLLADSLHRIKKQEANALTYLGVGSHFANILISAIYLSVWLREDSVK